MKPTEEQVEKLLKWCGFNLGGIHDFLGGINDFIGSKEVSTVYWVNPDREACDPDIDLNNLFKYPKQIIVKRFGIAKWQEILLAWFKEMMLGKDPAIALFWTIYKVMEESNDR